ncbi:MAG TPA: hypothetical protein VKU61_10935 [Candidatus Binatia bacterium]|nr:hypothetical protein [Candidatus Binatia bacterium]
MTRAAIVVVLALLAPACGQKNRVIPPELVRPETPDDLSAVATPEGVRLNWNRPTRYSGGGQMNDLDGFVIQRATGTGAVSAAYAEVGKVILNDQNRFRKERRIEWVDTTATPGNLYFYRVIAVTMDRSRSIPAGPVSLQFGTP